MCLHAFFASFVKEDAALEAPRCQVQAIEAFDGSPDEERKGQAIRDLPQEPKDALLLLRAQVDQTVPGPDEKREIVSGVLLGHRCGVLRDML